jgi:WYL domain
VSPVRIESPEVAVLDLLALGAEVEVVRPPELRAELARVARRIADLHTDGRRHR